MKPLSFLIFIILSLNATSQRAKINRQLQKDLEKTMEGFHGRAGIYVKDLRTNKTASINADTLFPTASMIKIPILIGIMDKLNHGQLQYHQPLIYKDSLLYAGVDILGSFKNNEKIELSKVMMLSLTMSDNTASLWLQSLAGGGKRINELLDSLGFSKTRMNSRTPGRAQNQAEFGWGQTTPYEMASLLERIYKGTILDKAASAKMLRLLGRNYWDENAISQIPSSIFIASKSGAVDQTRNETLLVMARHPYVFCICTKNNKDISWDDSNEAWQMTRKVSKFLWDYFSK